MIDFYPEDPAYYLKNELIERLRRRPQYSLRAFARDLEISPSTLSEFLRGQTKISIQRINSLSKKIKLPEEHHKHWIDLIQSKHSRVLAHKKNAELNIQMRKKSSKKYIDLAAYSLVASWESFAILEILGLSKKYSDAEIMKKLAISPAQYNLTIENLNRLNLIRREKDRWVSNEEDTFVGENVRSEALRKFHKGILKKAYKAIETQELDRRELRSTVFSFKKSDLPKIKSELNELWINLLSKYAYVPNRDAVYCLSMQLFDLSHED